MVSISPSPKVIARFLSKVDKTTSDRGCWLWQGAPNFSGYGRFGVESQNLLAHRVSHELFIGPVPDDLCVLHRCDVRMCVNPDHLFIGTKQDNVLDCAAKGRRGDRFATKVSESDVPLIRALYRDGVSVYAIADRFGISKSQAYNIAKGLQRRNVA